MEKTYSMSMLSQRRTNRVFKYLIRSLVALALAITPIPMDAATTMVMPASMAMQSGAGDQCDCAKDNTDCAKSETCFLKCATAPALEPKRVQSRFAVFTAAIVERLDPSLLDSLHTPPPHPPPRG